MTPAEIITFVDLTSLNDNDTDQTIKTLCKKAKTDSGVVAAVCIYPKFVPLAWTLLADTPVKIATVANFPGGKNSLDHTLQEIKQAILDGASEIDVVTPHNADFLKRCKDYCGNKALLKVILETGALNSEQIEQASIEAIEAGADFLKTSTGKIAIGATADAAEIMLHVIKKSDRKIGFKASGGIKTIEQAQTYIDLFVHTLGKDELTPKRFRLGASSLIDQLLGATKHA